MSVSIVRRPIGNRGGADKSATITNASGDALLNCLSHGVSNGTTVYVIGLVEKYNGFWQADVIDVNTFKLIDSETGEHVPFFKDLNVTFNVNVFEHNWSCVHLPIIYKLSSNLFPYSQVDGTYDWVPYGFVNGYFAISDVSIYYLGYAGVAVGDYIALYNHSNLFEVVEKLAPNIIVLNWNGSDLGDTTNTLDPGGTYFNGPFQKYYNNYHIKVQIYAGLSDTHYWESEKPYELVSTVNVVPDNDNQIMFSIAQEVMSKIKTLTNNLTLDTLPNNIDALAQFYITTQEIYDYGTGSGVSTLSGSILSDKDNFEGVAVNMDLPFKNKYSGYPSEYVVTNTTAFGDSLIIGPEIPASKFLTLFETPTIFSGHYFDISALISGSLDPEKNYMEFRAYYVDSEGNQYPYGGTGALFFPDNSLGIYRFKLEADCNYSSLEIYIIYAQDSYTPDLTERKTININCNCANYEIGLTWLNYLGGFDYWVFTGFTQHEIDIKGYTQRNKNIFPDWPKSYGETANTIRQETKRTSTIRKLIRSQPVSLNDVEALKYVKSSSLVQIIISETDLRTVTVDTDSFVVRNDGDRQHFIQFYIEYTDDIPAQRL